MVNKIKIKLRPSDEHKFHVTIARLEDEEGFLPTIPQELELALEEWRSKYRQLGPVRQFIEGTRLGEPRVTTINDYECANRVIEQLNRWLSSTDSRWLSLQERLVSIVSQLKQGKECIPVLIDAEDINLRRLPWQEWSLFEKFNWQAEFLLRVKGEGGEDIQPPRQLQKIRILVVVGRSDGIRTEDDLNIIQELKKKNAEVISLIQPTSQELCNALLDDKGYHIFIFTGHSYSLSNGQIGRIHVNKDESLSIDEFKVALKTAIDKGLQLAIFNSCDGLGLAHELAKLNLPRCIVMREPIPDEVAIEFLKYFFKEFTENKSLYESVHKARKHLEHFHIPKESENFYPGVMWLPTICIRQSALDQPLVWQAMIAEPFINISRFASQLPSVISSFLAGCVTTSLFFLFFNSARSTDVNQKSIMIDGSSTVYPLTKEVATDYQAKEKNKPEIPVLVSGTGGGFKKFCEGKTDINNASRPILKKEIERCKANGIKYIELPIAYDPLTLVVNRKNNWINSITLNELKKICSSQGTLTWSQVRDNLPNQPINFYSPGRDSGTFDYFTAITGQGKVCQISPHLAREDDDVLVRGISNDTFALGYIGHSYYLNNSSNLKALAVDSGSGAIMPSIDTTKNGSYFLKRPLFIYVNAKSARYPEVQNFVRYYINHVKDLVEKVGYAPLPNEFYPQISSRFEGNEVGTRFQGILPSNMKIEEFWQKKIES